LGVPHASMLRFVFRGLYAALSNLE